jgi:hypothetical protein
MIFVTFISIHFVIICDVLLWRTYETHLALPLKSGCDISLFHRACNPYWRNLGAGNISLIPLCWK